MKRKELMKIQAPVFTEKDIRKIVEEDSGEEEEWRNWERGEFRIKRYTKYRYKILIKTKIENGYLILSILERERLEDGVRKPDFIVYIDKKEKTWENYYVQEGKWRKSTIQNIRKTGQKRYYCTIQGESWEESSVSKTIKRYFGEKGKAMRVVQDWQEKILGEARQKRHQREKDYIDSWMEQVPELPKTFKKWVQDEGFYRYKYIFYKREKDSAKGWCTHCKNMVDIKEKPVHGKKGKCPHCRKEITYKAWGKQKSIENWVRIGILQEVKEDKRYLVLRIFNAAMKLKKEDWKEEKITYHEQERDIVSKEYLNVHERFEWGDFKQSRETRWCKAGERYMYGYAYRCEMVLYDKNIKNIRGKLSQLKYTEIEKLIRQKKGYECVPEQMLLNAKKYPQYELMIKEGLYSLCWEWMNSRYRGLNRERYRQKSNEKKMWNLLGLTKENYLLAKKIDITENELQILEELQKLQLARKIKIEKEMVEVLAECRDNLRERIYENGKILKACRYLKEQEQNKNFKFSDYGDYLEEIKELKLRKDKATIFPRNFMRAHQETSMLIIEKKEDLEREKYKEQNEKFKKILPEIKKLFEFEDETFKIVIPEEKTDFTREGQEQHNCVGGRYFERMLKKETVVFFIRKKEDLKKSYATVEVQKTKGKWEICQNRLIYNQDGDEASYSFLKKVLKQANEIEEGKQKVLLMAAV